LAERDLEIEVMKEIAVKKWSAIAILLIDDLAITSMA
jgi:hypothetical protein